jgi:hypothetical protein
LFAITQTTPWFRMELAALSNGIVNSWFWTIS